MKKSWRSLVVLLLCLIAYDALLIGFIYYADYKLLYSDDYTVDSNCIIVMGTISESSCLFVIEGGEAIKQSLPEPHALDLNTDRVKMSGLSIYDLLEPYDCWKNAFIVKGRVTGVTDEFSEDRLGTIPVFEASEIQIKWTLWDYLHSDTIRRGHSILATFIEWLIKFLPFWVFAAIDCVKTHRRKMQNA